jgi:UDP-N-acetylmuramate--alanine ligase
MVKTVDFSGKPFHFIGIGGIGMSALAYILAKRQIPVSGSDLRSSHITERLQAVGAHIFSSQEAANLELFQSCHQAVAEPLTALVGAAVGNGRGSASRVLGEKQQTAKLQVICSTAISANNSEYLAALQRGCPIFHRSDVLAALIAEYHSIAVAGTHGKTTTSSLLGQVLVEAALDPTIIVGGEVEAWGGNARLGKGDYLVAEADESDGSLTKHAPAIGIVTNIELDHPDHYQSLEDVVKIFKVFASQCETLVGCLDCEVVRAHLKPQITYSLNPDSGADYIARQVTCHAGGSTAEIWERGECLGTLHLRLPGQHNLSNALAVVATCRRLGLDFAAIAQGIASFGGAKRRFEHRGERQNITFIDDYAHHPSEIRATLAAARSQVGQEKNSRVVAIFQPHRYSRTATFLEEFATAFGDADVVVITDIYSAGEKNSHGLQGQHVAQAVSRHHQQVHFHADLKSLRHRLRELLQPGDMALFLGAGNLNQEIPGTIALYSAKIKVINP